MPRLSAGHYVSIVVLALWVTWAAAVYGSLPARIPTHFGGAGVPDAWSDRSVLSWFALPLVGVGLTVMLTLAGSIGRQFPQALNVPEKARFVALSAAKREEVLRVLDGVMGWIIASILPLLIVIHVQSYRVATGRAEGLGVAALVATVFAVAVPLVLALVLNTRMARRIRELSAGPA